MPQRTRARRRLFAVGLALCMLLSTFVFLGPPTPTALADDRLVVAVGSFQSELGCDEDWDPACEATQLQSTDSEGIYSTSFEVPAGEWEFKVALDGDWEEAYGLDGGDDNIALRIAGPTNVQITFDAGAQRVGISVPDLSGEYSSADDAIVAEPVRTPGSDEQFYFVLTDRFANGDTSNDTGGIAGDRLDHGFDPQDKGFFNGGDIAGLMDNLDYIEGLGTSAIWLTPSFTNQPVQGIGTDDVSAGYHGYWVTDFTSIDPHLGSNAELEELIDAAHERGMKVYFDIITNHTADIIDYDEGEYDYVEIGDEPYTDADGNEFDPGEYAGTGTFPELDASTSFPYTPQAREGLEDAKTPDWLNDVTLYHNRGDSTWEGESVTYGDFFGLDDLMTEHPDVVDGFIDVYTDWVDMGVDGFRIDTGKHVNFEFWEEWTTAVMDHARASGNEEFFMFGEVFDADARLLSPYVRDTDMSSVLDFAFQSSAVNFARGSTTRGLSGLFDSDDYYTTPTSSADALPTFLGNHDMGRVGYFLEGSGQERDRSMLAHSLMYLTRGQPVVYYGDEQGFIGSGGDKDSRQSLFASQVTEYQEDWTLHGDQIGDRDRYDTDVPLYEHIGGLADLREGSAALTSGAQIELHSDAGAGVYAFARVDRDEQVEHLVALNNSTQVREVTFTTLTADATYAPLWGEHEQVSTDSEGSVTLTVPPLGAVVLRADDQVSAPEEPGEIALTPARGGEVTGVSPIAAEIAPAVWAETSFAYRQVGTQEWSPLGTAEGDDPRVFHDTASYPTGTLIEYRAVSVDAAGNRIAASTVGSVGQSLDLSVEEPGVGADFVTVPGSHNAAMGCTGDWQPDCEDAALTLGPDGLYSGTFELPAGTYEYKVAVGGSWDVNYGAGGVADGDNVSYTHGGGEITFFYNPVTHQFINTSEEGPIVTLPGSFNAAVGCADDWEPACMATWMGLPDDDGVYTWSTAALEAGEYEVKAAHGRSWDENYGVDGVLDGDNYTFTVTGDQLVVFRYDITTNLLTITEEELPVEGVGESRAQWIDTDTIAWPAEFGAPAASATWSLHHAPEGGLTLGAGEVTGGEQVELTPIAGGLSAEQRERFPHLSSFVALRVEGLDEATIADILTGQMLVLQRDALGTPTALTGVQIPGVLDDLYAEAAADRALGATWDDGDPSLALWAPTAKNVSLLLGGDVSGDDEPQRVQMQAQDDGSWTVDGQSEWANQLYRFEVEVYVPEEGEVVANAVTDPYSVGLSVDSTHSVLIDLDDPAWAPQQWADAAQPQVRPVDQTIYEMHVRDFSINDETVPEELRGTYEAFTVESDGTDHLRELADAGLTTLHLLPTFDIATIPELSSDQVVPQIPDAAPDSPDQQAALADVRAQDGFNWGYDPWHYNTPEGSYATDANQHGGDRVREFRSMVGALHDMDLQVVVDQVYNHTSASGQSEKSVLDRVVPGYYHRLSEAGSVETSTCCENVATEHQMAQKLMVDSVVVWARDYRIDGFRFDLMGHHSVQNMQAVRDALDELTVDADGVDGSAIYLYGEGWNFGEVADNARFTQATQGQLGGTGIGTFSDRQRDAVRGGGPFDEDKRSVQGFGSGLFTDPNDVAEGSESEQQERLAHQTDIIRLGLAGNLRDFTFTTSGGDAQRGDEIDYNGQPAGYADSPEEIITYVDKHDNETLYDILAFKLPTDTSMADRVRMNHLSQATTALAQTPSFWHAGTDLLRSKSLDRNSYDSGDHFNRIDWTRASNNFGVGLPPGWEDQDDVWPQMQPLLANPDLMPEPDDIEHSAQLAKQLLELRFLTPLIRLGSADLINEKVSFPESGTDAEPGLITMFIDDRVGEDVDPDLDAAMVAFNASPEEIVVELGELAGRQLELSEIQADGVDEVVKDTAWDAESGTLTIPARSAAVLVEPQDAQAEITVDPSSVAPGAEVTVTGTGYAAGEEVTISLDEPVVAAAAQWAGARLAFAAAELDTAVADDAGSFSVVLTVDEGAEPGEYEVTATGTESGRSARAPLTVTEDPGPTPTEEPTQEPPPTEEPTEDPTEEPPPTDEPTDQPTDATPTDGTPTDGSPTDGTPTAGPSDGSSSTDGATAPGEDSDSGTGSMPSTGVGLTLAVAALLLVVVGLGVLALRRRGSM